VSCALRRGISGSIRREHWWWWANDGGCGGNGTETNALRRAPKSGSGGGDGPYGAGTKHTHTHIHTVSNDLRAVVVYGRRHVWWEWRFVGRWENGARGVLCTQYRGKTTPPRSSAVAGYRRRLVGYNTSLVSGFMFLSVRRRCRRVYIIITTHMYNTRVQLFLFCHWAAVSFATVPISGVGGTPLLRKRDGGTIVVHLYGLGKTLLA
jgi:hypothetical protein